MFPFVKVGPAARGDLPGCPFAFAFKRTYLFPQLERGRKLQLGRRLRLRAFPSRGACLANGPTSSHARGNAHAKSGLEVGYLGIRRRICLRRATTASACYTAGSSAFFKTLTCGFLRCLQRRVQPLRHRHRRLLARTSFAAWVDARLTRAPTPARTSISRSGVGLRFLLRFLPLDRSLRNGTGRCDAHVGG